MLTIFSFALKFGNCCIVLDFNEFCSLIGSYSITKICFECIFFFRLFVGADYLDLLLLVLSRRLFFNDSIFLLFLVLSSRFRVSLSLCLLLF